MSRDAVKDIPPDMIIPEGYALVPLEPTPDAVGAWYRVKNGFHFADEPAPDDTNDFAAYRALIAAARLSNPPVQS